MVEPAGISPQSPTLEARPPTPPRESGRNDLRTNFLGRFFKRDSFRKPPSPSDVTPDSSAESPSQISGSARKKVGWSDSTEYNEPPTVEFNGKGLSHAVQPLAPSAERKPSKSILKAYNGIHEQEYNDVANSKLLPPHQHATFSTMLESIVQQLGGKDRSSKMDAYLMLSGSLKASENIPDVKALKDRMPQLCQYIEQDLTAKLETGKPDSTLITNALVLLSAFLYKSTLADSLPFEFSVHLVDHSIKIFEDGSMSKEVVKHTMFVLAQQKFPAKVMNQDRVGRLIAALHKVEQHIKGQSIIVQRLQIYRALLRQSKPHMLAHTAWIKDLFVEMTATSKETRTHAVTFGLEVGINIGAERRPCREMMDLFKRSHIDIPTFGDYFANRLKKMAKNKEDSMMVPQIWSVVVLLFRYNPQLLPTWQFLNPFLEVITICFNSSDAATKNEANYAWNRLIFTVQPSEKTPPRFIEILSSPLVTQLSSRKSGRKATLSSVYTLLYYSLKPTATAAELDLYWDQYVALLVGKTLISGGRDVSDVVKNATDACTILQCLFDCSTLRQWSETRSMDNLNQNAMLAKELPALDSKWLRKNSQRVFPLVDSLLEKLYWNLSDDTSIISKLWQAYTTSVASPAAKEISISIDTMSSIAAIFGTLHRLWNAGPKGLALLRLSNTDGIPPGNAAFLGSFETIVLTTISQLGVRPFTEKHLSIAQDTFVVVATPSNQSKKIRAETKPPLHHLLLLLASVSPGLEYDGRFLHLIRSILLPFIQSQTKSKSRLEFARDLANILPTTNMEPPRLIWQVLAEFASAASDIRDAEESSTGHDSLLGAAYRVPVRVLEVGSRLSPHKPLPGWSSLLDAVVNSATIDAGDGGRAIAVVEPLAKALNPTLSTLTASPTGITYLHLLLLKSSYPRDRQAFDAARKRLWGASNAGSSSSTFDPYSHLYQYLRLSLENGYTSFSKQHVPEYSDVISATTALLRRCPAHLVLGTLSKIQTGMLSWVADSESHITGGSSLSDVISLLWSTVCDILPRLQELHSDTKVLTELQMLLCAGLESRHRAIVNLTIRAWNSTFGTSRTSFEYPESLKLALIRLRPMAEILLPFIPDTAETEDPIDQGQAPVFADAHDDLTSLSDIKTPDFAFRPYHEPQLIRSIERKIRQSTPQVVIRSIRSTSRKRSSEATPEPNGRKVRKRDITPKLRHDDSQIQFEAIESSPMADRVIDSQLLTDKQKEVKERQEADAAMFPDLRTSSPGFKATLKDKSPADLELPLYRSSSRLRSKTPPRMERQTTPNLCLPSDDDQFITSSPTPTRSTHSKSDLSGPPSSPPEVLERATPSHTPKVSSSTPELTPEPENDIVGPITSPIYGLARNTDIEDAQSNPCNEMLGRRNLNGNVISSNGMATNSALSDEAATSPCHEKVLASSNEILTSFDPSAQIDPYALENTRPFSTYESTPREENSSALDDIALQLELEKENSDSPGHENMDKAKLCKSKTPTKAESALKTPLVPEDLENRSPLGLKSPPFMDAPTSPFSSDRQTENDDIFEDAVSSPRLHTDKSNQEETSSFLSYLDESSAMRLVAKYDSAFVPKTNSKEIERDVLQGSSPMTSPINNMDMISHGPSGGLESAIEQRGLHEVSSDATHGSSMPSLIPETPAAKAVDPPTKTFFDDDGEELDMASTIIVDCSALDVLRRHTTRRRGMRKRWATNSKKRKHQDTLLDPSEVPDSQDPPGQIEGYNSPNKPFLPKKKRKDSNRSARALYGDDHLEDAPEFEQNLSQEQLSEDLEADQCQDQSQSSLDIDASLADIEGNRTTNKFTVSDVANSCDEREIEEGVIMMKSDLDENAMDEAVKLLNSGLDSEIPSMGGGQGESPRREMVEEAAIEEMDLLENSGSFLSQPILESSHHNGFVSVLDNSTSEPVATTFESKPSAVLDVGLEVEGTILQMVKKKLQGVITDLQGTTLSRQEVHELEDIFMDAKRQLYEAELRGRQLVDI